MESQACSHSLSGHNAPVESLACEADSASYWLSCRARSARLSLMDPARYERLVNELEAIAHATPGALKLRVRLLVALGSADYLRGDGAS